MEQSSEVRSDHLIQVSGHLSTRMSELLALREAVRTAEAIRCGNVPVHAAVNEPRLGAAPKYRAYRA